MGRTVRLPTDREVLRWRMLFPSAGAHQLAEDLEVPRAAARALLRRVERGPGLHRGPPEAGPPPSEGGA